MRAPREAERGGARSAACAAYARALAEWAALAAAGTSRTTSVDRMWREARTAGCPA